MALLLIALDIDSGRGMFVNCGQIPPIVFGSGGARFLAGGSPNGDPPLGILSKLDLHLRPFQLQREETLVLVSDGVVEAMNPKNEPLGFERLFSVGVKGGPDMEGQHRAMFRLIESHAAGAPQHDDATVVVLNRTS